MESLETTKKLWLSIDIGIVHLALVLVEVTQEFEFDHVVWHRLIDIRKLRHSTVPAEHCRLGHTSTVTDRMAHVYQEYEHVFLAAERILVERQPIMGLQAVQESLFAQFRDKMTLVLPNSVHKLFKMSNNYENRKQESVNLARDYFYSINNPLYPAGKALADASSVTSEKFECYLDKLNKTEIRNHDIADAICMVIFILKKESQALAKKRKKEEIAARPLIRDLNQFRRGEKQSSPIRFLKPSLIN